MKNHHIIVAKKTSDLLLVNIDVRRMLSVNCMLSLSCILSQTKTLSQNDNSVNIAIVHGRS